MNPNPNMDNMINNYNLINNMVMSNPNNKDKEVLLNLIEQNIQMTNQIAINNNMIKNMIKNSDFSNNIKENEFNKLYDIDFFPRRKGEKINGIFEKDPLTKIFIICPSDAKINEVLDAFFVRLQFDFKLDKNVYDNNKLEDYFFIHNAKTISLEDNRTLSECGFHPYERIIFQRKNDLIG